MSVFSSMKLSRLVALVGIALLLSGFISGKMLADFDENKQQTVAVIYKIEDGGILTNGDKVCVRYNVNGEEYEGKLPSNDMQSYIDMLESSGQTLKDAANSAAKIDVVYHAERPGSVKYVEYSDPSEKLYAWGAILLSVGIAMWIIKKAMDKKKADRKAEKKAEKMLEKQQNNANKGKPNKGK